MSILNIVIAIVVVAVIAYGINKIFGLNWFASEEEEVKKVLDVNKDGKVNMADAGAAVNKAIKKVKKSSSKK